MKVLLSKQSEIFLKSRHQLSRSVGESTRTGIHADTLARKLKTYTKKCDLGNATSTFHFVSLDLSKRFGKQTNLGESYFLPIF